MLGLGWKRQLRRASFRGASFYIEQYGGEFGRRHADHEYPGRDTPFAEDLGRRQRVWRFTGYVIGDRYPSERDRLLQACEQQGPGELVHPTIGTVQAVCRSVSFTEERERGRYCGFQFEFAEAGQLQEPADATDANSACGIAAGDLGTAGIASFLSGFDTSGGGAWLNQAAQTDIQGLAQELQQLRLPAPTAPQSELGQSLNYLSDNSAALAANPPALASGVDTAFGAFTDAGEAAPVTSAMLRFVSPDAAADFATTFALHGGVSLPLTIRRARNTAAFTQFIHRLALREIGYAVTGLDLDNYDQAIQTLNQIVAAFALVERAAADAGDDEVFMALAGLRGAITRMIGARAANLNPLITYRLPVPANSLTLAWRLYQDSGRDLEIVRRTSARNPTFLPMTGRVLAA
jgi:hypothetical protein